MKQYAVYDDRGRWLFNITAGSKFDALSLAKKADRRAARVEFMFAQYPD